MTPWRAKFSVTFNTRNNFKGIGNAKGGRRTRQKLNERVLLIFYRKGCGYGEAKNGHAKEARWRV